MKLKAPRNYQEALMEDNLDGIINEANQEDFLDLEDFDEEEAYGVWKEFCELQNVSPKEFYSQYLSTFDEMDEFHEWLKEYEEEEGIVLEESSFIFLETSCERIAVFLK